MKGKMKARFSPLAALLCLSCLGGALLQSQGTIPPESSPSDTSLTEAEILIYVLPDSQVVRKQRGDISWEVEAGPAQNTKDFYTFYVVGPIAEGEASSTIGHFSVNKHTADVWDTVFNKLTVGADLAGIQKILREGHHIDARTIQRYRGVNP